MSGYAVPGIEHVADNEDGVMWFARCTARQARREFASLVGERPWHYKATATFMRPAVCELHPKSVWKMELDDEGIDRELDRDACECSRVEEGWQYTCDADHPQAKKVWQVEERYPPRWWWKVRSRLRKLHPDTRRAFRRRVLWGGRVERKARWFDRLLLGRGRVLILGDVWLRSEVDVARGRRELAEARARRAARLTAQDQKREPS